VEEVGSQELLGVERAVQRSHRVRNRRHEDHEQEDVRDVELPDAMADADGRDEEALALHAPAVHHPGGVAGDQDEHLGRVTEHDRLQRELRQEVVGEVVEEYAEQGEAAEEVQAQVTPRLGHRDLLRAGPVEDHALPGAMNQQR
jgi:hypothetical protein